jgi:hypothetical protein
MIIKEIKNIKSDKKELKKFGLTIGTVLQLVGIVLLIYGNAIAPIFVIIGSVMLVISLTFPILLLPLQKIWMSLAVVLGFIMTRVILSVLFYLVITPINFISRIFSKDFLDLKIDKEKKSYWNLRDEKYEKSSTEKQY